MDAPTDRPESDGRHTPDADRDGRTGIADEVDEGFVGGGGYWSDAIILFVLALGLYWTGNHLTGLWDRDEGRFALPAYEMLTSGEYVVPHFNGEPFFHKPPLTYWAITVAYRIAGVNEFAARLPSGLAMAGVCVLVYVYGAWWRGRRCGLIAAAVMMTSVLSVATGKLAISDAILTLLVAGVLMLLHRSLDGHVSWWATITATVAAGLAILCKGPALLVMVAPVLAGSLLIRTYRMRLLSVRWIAALAGVVIVAMVISLPWYIYCDVRTDGALWERFVGYDIWQRIHEPAESHGGPPGFYLATGLAALLPWSILLPGALVTAWQDRRKTADVAYWLVWLAGPVLPLELMATKMIHYLLPILPAAALLIGHGVDQWVTHRQRAPKVGLRLPAIVAGVFVAAMAAAVLAGGWYLRSVSALLVVAMAGLVVGAVVVAMAGSWQDLVLRLFVVSAVATLCMAVIVMPMVDRQRLNTAVVRMVQQVAGENGTVATLKWRPPSFYYYLRTAGLTVEDIGDQPASYVQRLREGNDTLTLVVADRVLDRLGELGQLRQIPVEGFDLTRGRWDKVWIVRATTDKVP